MAAQRATCFIKPNGPTGAGAAITWSIMDTASGDTDFTSEYFTSVGTSGSNVVLNYPTVLKVKSIAFGVSPGLAQAGIFLGASVQTGQAIISLYQMYGCSAGRLTGAGSSFTRSGDVLSYTVGTNNANTFTFTPNVPYGGTAGQNAQYFNYAQASYVGSNDRRLKKLTSGLGGQSFGYQLLDSAGVAVVTNDANDIIEIIVPQSPKTAQINCSLNNGSGFPGAVILLATNYISVHAEFDV